MGPIYLMVFEKSRGFLRGDLIYIYIYICVYILIRTLPGSRAQKLLIRCMFGVDDYFASEVNQIDESGAHRQKK